MKKQVNSCLVSIKFQSFQEKVCLYKNTKHEDQCRSLEGVNQYYPEVLSDQQHQLVLNPAAAASGIHSSVWNKAGLNTTVPQPFFTRGLPPQ